MTKKQEMERERDEARDQLRQYLKPGDTVYTILRHVSRSGMHRHVSIVLIKNGEPSHPNYLVAKLVGRPLISTGGFDAVEYRMVVSDIAEEIGWALWDDASALKQRWL